MAAIRASQPMPAMSVNGSPSARPRSIAARWPSRWAASAFMGWRGMAASFAQTLAVPPGSTASADSEPATAPAASRTVPSPPSTNTKASPRSAARAAAAAVPAGESGSSSRAP